MRRLLLKTVGFLGYYLLGIVACVLLTPVELTLIDRPVWLFYAPLAALGYAAFYVSLPPQYVFGPTAGYWTVYVLGLASVLVGLMALVMTGERFRRWSPLLIGLPLGFVGTLGVYFSIAASI